MIEKDQVAVVTGSAQGIGRGIALALAKRGVQVLCLDIKDEENRKTAAEAARISGTDCGAYHCDVSKADEVSRVFDSILADIGRVDILVNNAGVFEMMTFVETSYEDAIKNYDLNFGTNVFGTFLCSKKVAPHMAQRGSGQILNVITNHLKRTLFPPSTNEHSYDASKWAQYGLNESLDCELKQYGIRVNAICPAATRTPMLQDFFDTIGLPLNKKTLGECSGFECLLESDEVGEAACHILDWDDSQPTGKSFLLMYSEDCACLKNGFAPDLVV